jgi:hypothetical protein
LACEHAKRHRPPPEGRRYTSGFHTFHLNEAKEIRSPKRRQKLLTAILGSAILGGVQDYEESFRDGDVRGLFSFAR